MQLNTTNSTNKLTFYIHQYTCQFEQQAKESNGPLLLIVSNHSLKFVVEKLIDWNTMNVPTCIAYYSDEQLSWYARASLLETQGKISELHLSIPNCDNYNTIQVPFRKLMIVPVYLEINGYSIDLLKYWLCNKYYIRKLFVVNITNGDKWKQILQDAENNSQSQYLLFFRDQFDVLSESEAMYKNVVPVNLVDHFPVDCFTNIMQFIGVKDWFSFSLTCKKSYEYTDRVLWRELYYRMVGHFEIPDDKTYLEMCCAVTPQMSNIEDNSESPFFSQTLKFSDLDDETVQSELFSKVLLVYAKYSWME
jgi:hypothetical protein